MRASRKEQKSSHEMHWQVGPVARELHSCHQHQRQWHKFAEVGVALALKQQQNTIIARYCCYWRL